MSPRSLSNGLDLFGLCKQLELAGWDAFASDLVGEVAARRQQLPGRGRVEFGDRPQRALAFHGDYKTNLLLTSSCCVEATRFSLSRKTAGADHCRPAESMRTTCLLCWPS